MLYFLMYLQDSLIYIISENFKSQRDKKFLKYQSYTSLIIIIFCTICLRNHSNRKTYKQSRVFLNSVTFTSHIGSLERIITLMKQLMWKTIISLNLYCPFFYPTYRQKDGTKALDFSIVVL